MRLEYLTSNFSLLPKNQSVHSVLSGKHASLLRGRGLDFSEVRQYTFGDDIRNIDWKVTARTRVTHTKVFNEEKERPSFMIVDQSSSMFFASEGTMKSVIAAKIATIAGFKVLKDSDRIGGLVFNDDSYEYVVPKRSRKSLLHLLELIVNKNQKLVTHKKMSSNKAFINKVLFKAQNIITHNSVVVVVSDFKQLDNQGRIYLSTIARHNDVIAVLISDSMEENLPSVKIPIGDGNQQLVLSGKDKIRLKFKEQTKTKRQETIHFLRKYNIPVMELNTVEPLVDQIKQIFGRF